MKLFHNWKGKTGEVIKSNDAFNAGIFSLLNCISRAADAGQASSDE